MCRGKQKQKNTGRGKEQKKLWEKEKKHQILKVRSQKEQRDKGY